MQAGQAHFPELGSGGKSDLADIFRCGLDSMDVDGNAISPNSPKVAFFVISFRNDSSHKSVDRNVGQKNYSAVFSMARCKTAP